jgi:fumarate hydratase class I
MDFIYQDPCPILKDDTQYRKITSDYVKVEKLGDRNSNHWSKGTEITFRGDERCFVYVTYFAFRKVESHSDDPEATDNDRFVAYNLLQNAAVAIEGQLPSCQDTGTAIVMAKKEMYIQCRWCWMAF